jgi:hypothetical protein
MSYGVEGLRNKLKCFLIKKNKKPHFPFSGKPGANVDLEYPSNPMEYFQLFIAPKLLN